MHHPNPDQQARPCFVELNLEAPLGQHLFVPGALPLVPRSGGAQLRGIPGAREDLCLVTKYSLKMAQQHSPDTLNHVLDTAEVVLRWWMAQPRGDHPSLPKAITWLQTLNKQVGRDHATHHTHGSTLTQDNVRQGASCRWQEHCIGIRPQWWS